MESCYKAVRTDVLKSISIASNDFRFEPELALKLARRQARLFEVLVMEPADVGVVVAGRELAISRAGGA